ncbi:MAG: PIN domain-containing protein [Terracidiphilus sp.]|jgi:predicted nucleic acid-binding protein
MTAKAFFDTNLLVYALAVRASARFDPRTEMAEKTLSIGGVISVQVLNEFADVTTGKFKMEWDAVEQCLEVIDALCGRAIPLTAETHCLAIAISKRHGFRIYDSMILAAALQAGCTTVYTEDLQHGQMIEGLRIENPFR